MLKREGLFRNHERSEKIKCEEGHYGRKRRVKSSEGMRLVMLSAQKPNERRSMDFVTDSIVPGRRFRALAIIDDWSRKCPVIEVDISLGCARVVNVLEILAAMRKLPM
jgi:putative transposase